jgi:hypothetical protein
MEPTNCKQCGETVGAHYLVRMVNNLQLKVCPTAVYTPVATPSPVLDLDAMQGMQGMLAQGTVPGSPAARGKVWSPSKNRWVDPNQEPV